MPKADDPQKPAPAPREAKLAQALRANLRRRKQAAPPGAASKAAPGRDDPQ